MCGFFGDFVFTYIAKESRLDNALIASKIE